MILRQRLVQEVVRHRPDLRRRTTGDGGEPDQSVVSNARAPAAGKRTNTRVTPTHAARDAPARDQRDLLRAIEPDTAAVEHHRRVARSAQRTRLRAAEGEQP